MALVGGASLNHGSENLNYDETTDITKIILGTTTGQTKTNGTSDTVNSGSTNTTNQHVATGTSGSVNTTQIGASTSSTFNSGRTDTQQLMLTDAAVNHLANQMLESNQGLASVVKGDNISGGYNSTTKGLLASDLVSRISGEVAARGAMTVTKIGSSSSDTFNSGSTNTQTIGPTSGFTDTDVTQIIGGSTSHTSSQSIADTINNTKTEEHTASQIEGTKEKDTKQQEAHAGWIVCTELNKQGRLPHKFYRYGFLAFAKYDEQGKKGYYIWAVPAVKHLRKHPYSLLSRIMCSVFNARAEHLSAVAGCKTAKKSLYGAITVHGLYAICWTLSRTVARNYEVSTSYNGVYKNA